MRKLTLIHIAVNAILLWLAYYWLGVGESRALTLVWSLVVTLAAVSLASVQYGAVFAWFRNEARPWRTAARHLAPLVVAAVAVATLYLLFARWADYSAKPANAIASWLTLTIRKPVHPATVLGIFNVVLWLVRWVVAPVLALPMVAAIAAVGWRGFRAIGAGSRKWLYWLEVPLVLLCGLWLPLKLLGWVPHFEGFGWQMLSFVTRAALAFALFAAAGLALGFVTAGPKPGGAKAAAA